MFRIVLVIFSSLAGYVNKHKRHQKTGRIWKVPVTPVTPGSAYPHNGHRGLSRFASSKLFISCRISMTFERQYSCRIGSHLAASCCLTIDQRHSFKHYRVNMPSQNIVNSCGYVWILLHFPRALERNNVKPHWYELDPIASWGLASGTKIKLGLSKLQVHQTSAKQETKQDINNENTAVVTRRDMSRGRVARAF